jgi:predicted RNA-binding protein with PIN domain
MVRWLIDGYNVIRSDPDLRAQEATSLEAGRRALIHLVAALARRSRDEFTVVFDGARGNDLMPATGRVTVVFSRAPETADDVVIRLAGRLRTAAVVVTSDRRITHAAARARAGVIDAPTFAERARRAAMRDDAGALRGVLGASAAGASALDAAAAEKDDDADEAPARKGGNPRRASKKARAATRALRRLHPS